MSQSAKRGRFSLFAANTPGDNAPDLGPDIPEERHELDIGDPKAAMRRLEARRGWKVAESSTPLSGAWDADGHVAILPPPMVPVEVALSLDADGHVILPPELIAERAAEAAEEEKQRIADLARLDELQARRWNEWRARYEERQPDTLEVYLGPRGWSEARIYLQPYRFEDTDERHPDGPRIEVSGVTMHGEPPQGHSAPVRVYPNERILDMIRQQYLSATWRKEWEHPRGPDPRIAQAVAAWEAEERKREACRRSGYGGYRGSGINW